MDSMRSQTANNHKLSGTQREGFCSSSISKLQHPNKQIHLTLTNKERSHLCPDMLLLCLQNIQKQPRKDLCSGCDRHYYSINHGVGYCQSQSLTVTAVSWLNRFFFSISLSRFPLYSSAPSPQLPTIKHKTSRAVL